MKYCPNGHEVSDKMKFCPKCGEKVEENHKQQCQQCGFERQGTEKFCPKCGTPFESSEIIEEKKNPIRRYAIVGLLCLMALILGYVLFSTNNVKPTVAVEDEVVEIANDDNTSDSYDNTTSQNTQEQFDTDDNNEKEKERNDFHHDFNSSSNMQHNLSGTFRDDTGVYPIEISFSNQGNEISNVVYKNVRVGSKISMTCTKFGNNRICFQGKDGKNLFVISLNNTDNDSFVGNASVGDKYFDVEVSAMCSH